MADPRDPAEPVADYARAPRPGGDAPVPGAQWDELHDRWEVWDEPTRTWLAVDPVTGARTVPVDDLPLPPPLLGEEARPAVEIDLSEPHVIDVDRLAAPDHPVPGAQWNEVVGRWETWDEAAGAWVEARTEGFAQT